MTLSSPPMGDGSSELAGYEGLVGRTSQLHHAQVGLEESDMRQELWITVLKALRAYSPARSRLSQRSYVFGCVTNRVKDMKRDAARRANGRLALVHVEEGSRDWFEFTFQSATHDQTFGIVEDGHFRLPATITSEEARILFLLVIGYKQTEIALEAGVPVASIERHARSIRQKFADWRPGDGITPAPERTPERIAVAA